MPSLSHPVAQPPDVRERKVELPERARVPGRPGQEWASAGCSPAGCFLGVTPLCTMGFDPVSLRMRLVSVHPGIGIDEVRDATELST